MAIPIGALLKSSIEKSANEIGKKSIESDRPKDNLDLPESNDKSKDIDIDDSERPDELGDELPESNSDASEEDTVDNSDNPEASDTSEISEGQNTFSDLDTMKTELGKNYGEIKEDKPPNSPNIAKWFENGGSIKVEEVDGKSVWTYIDKDGREVKYVDGYPVFPPEAKHPVLGDINIGEFTGERNEDKKLYLKALEEQYGLTEIPEGYALHHDSENGNMQLVKLDWHKEFTHAGGHSKYKED